MIHIWFPSVAKCSIQLSSLFLELLHFCIFNFKLAHFIPQPVRFVSPSNFFHNDCVYHLSYSAISPNADEVFPDISQVAFSFHISMALFLFFFFSLFYYPFGLFGFFSFYGVLCGSDEICEHKSINYFPKASCSHPR